MIVQVWTQKDYILPLLAIRDVSVFSQPFRAAAVPAAYIRFHLL
jgi:hypothetical protein